MICCAPTRPATNNVVQERYLTISAHKRSVDEARAYFQRMGGEVTARLGQLSSQAEELDASARLQILRDFFKAGQPAVVPFNMEQRAKRGHDFRDLVLPGQHRILRRLFQIRHPMGPGAVFTGLCQLYQG